VCNTCVHLGHCNPRECTFQALNYKAIGVIHTPNTIVYQKISSKPTNVIAELNKKFNDYYFNVEFVVRNLRNMVDFLKKYHKIYKYSIFVKDVYQQQLTKNSEFILKRDGLEDRNIDLYINALKKIDTFYARLCAAKIKLEVNKVYCKINLY